MQGLVNDKTFHLKWNNHLQNLSQLFATIYSSSALADVTLSCRDGTLKAHKLVLSACSPYFEQIFKDNPCQHPIVILKGIPFSEINLLVEFMYKGAVDVQELDLQSLMHTASELEVRGLAYEPRDNAAQLLNVNLAEYPTYGHTATTTATTNTPSPSTSTFPGNRTDVERLKQIHMYQQSMMRAEEIRRRRRPEDPTHAAVNNILAAAAREMEESRQSQARNDRPSAIIQTELQEVLQPAVIEKRDVEEVDKVKKRVSILSSEEEKLRVKKKMHTVRFQDDVKGDEVHKYNSTGNGNGESKIEESPKASGIKVVQLAALQNLNDTENDCDDKNKSQNDEEEDTDSSESTSNGDPTISDPQDNRPHVCDLCDQRFQRASHLSRHRLTHTGERPFTCGGCGRSFARSDKLRMHTKICEKEDPTVDMTSDSPTKRETNSEVMSGMVRSTHRESGHLIFTASDSLLACGPKTEVHGAHHPNGEREQPTISPLPFTPKILTCYSLFSVKSEPQDPFSDNEIDPKPPPEKLDPIKIEIPPRRGRGRPRKIKVPPVDSAAIQTGDVMLPRTSQSGGTSDGREGDYDPPRRGRGRPRKTPLPLTPKIKKKRGRPPKTSLDGMEGCVLTGGSMLGPSPQSHVTSASLLLKRKRGRPPKNYFMPRTGMDMALAPFGLSEEISKFYGRPNENYNATNLPFGDFSYLTEMMYNPALAYSYGVPNVGQDGSADGQATDTERTIDVSDTESDSDEPRMEIEENVPHVACETQIMTVGDCQIVKLPPEEEPKVSSPEVTKDPAPGTLTITPITTVGDCTIRPVDNNT